VIVKSPEIGRNPPFVDSGTKVALIIASPFSASVQKTYSDVSRFNPVIDIVPHCDEVCQRGALPLLVPEAFR